MEYQLLESIGVWCDEVILLDEHIDRITRSARELKFEFNPSNCREEIIKQSQAITTKSLTMLRVLLSRSGSIEINTRDLSGWHKPVLEIPTREQLNSLSSEKLKKVSLASSPIEIHQTFSFHKTTRRSAYDDIKSSDSTLFDTIAFNNNLIVEGCITNIAIYNNQLDKWITPHSKTGCLPGTLRRYLLETNQVIEGDVPLDCLTKGMRLLCFNSVRGIVPVEVV